MNHQLPQRDFSESLLEYRRAIDELDAQLVSLLAARFAVTRRIGALKAEHGARAADPEREQAQLERLVLLSRELDLPTEMTRELYQTLFRFVRENHLTHSASASASRGQREPGH